MSETGFFAQKQRSPTGLALVILLHAALIAAVILIKSPAFQRLTNPPTVVTLIDDPAVPPPDPPRPRPHDQPQHPLETIDHSDPLVDTHFTGPTVDTTHQNTIIADNNVGVDRVELPPPPPPPIPVRRAAQIDPSSQLQPPYPPSEQRAERDGRVQVRVTIGSDGRVTDVALVSATSDAFWLVTRQQALRHWRFRPATVDGRPVEETRLMSVVFRIQDQG